MTRVIKDVDPVPHGLRIDNSGKAFLTCPVRRNVEKSCPVHRLLRIMGSGAFVDGETPETGEYTVRLVRAVVELTNCIPQYDSWIDVQPKLTKEHTA